MIPIFLVWIGVEFFYRYTPNNYTFKSELIKKHSDNIKVLILGDSHAFYGLNPEYFSKPTLNMANVSQTIYFDKLVFEKYIDELTQLEYLIIPIEYTTFSQADNTQEDYWRKYFYAAQMDINVPNIKWYDPKQYSLALTQKLGKTGTYLRSYLANSTLVECDNNGWGNTYLSSVDSLELNRLAKIISRKHDDGSMDFSINKTRIDKIIEACKEKNVKVILINMPVSEPYLKLLNQKEVNALIETCEALANTNSNVTNINLLHDNRFERKDFRDADHLNFEGAKKCSLIVNYEIENL